MRDLTPIVADLSVALENYRARGLFELYDFTADLSAGLILERAAHGTLSGWMDEAYQRHNARARLKLTSDGYVLTDERIVSPRLAASRLRAWYALELQWEEPTGTVIEFRLFDGTDELYWDGASWIPFVDYLNDRNSAAVVMANFASFSPLGRELSVVAYLSTQDPAQTPAFFGALVLYGVAIYGCDDDAQIRTFLATVRSELTASGYLEFLSSGVVSAIPVPPGEASEPLAALVSVDAVFNQTDDPTESTPLSGTLAGGTWTLDTPIPAGKHVRVEYTYRPNAVISRHRDATKIKRLPALIFEATGTSRDRSGSKTLIRNVTIDPPTAEELDPPDRLILDLQVRIISEFERDSAAIRRAWRAWFGGQNYRLLVSSETGRFVEVHHRGALEDTTSALTVGLIEARGTVRLAYSVARQDTSSARPLVRSGGVNTSIGE